MLETPSSIMVRVISAEQLHDVGNAGLAGGGQAVEVRAADGAGVGAEREGLDDVGAAADAAVDDDFHAAATPLDDVRQHVQRAGHVVQLPAAVVADLDGVEADVGGRDGVLGVDASLEDDRPVPARRRSRMSSQSVGSKDPSSRLRHMSGVLDSGPSGISASRFGKAIASLTRNPSAHARGQCPSTTVLGLMVGGAVNPLR